MFKPRMFRSRQIVISTCLLRTHRSLLLLVKKPQLPVLPEPPFLRWDWARAGRTLCHGPYLGPLHVVDGKERVHGELPHKSGEGEASLFQEASLKALPSSCSPTRGCSVAASLPHDGPELKDPKREAVPSNCPSRSQDSGFAYWRQTPTTRPLELPSLNPCQTTLLEHFRNPKSPSGSDLSKCLSQKRQIDNIQSLASEERADLTISIRSHERSHNVLCDTFRKYPFPRSSVSTATLDPGRRGRSGGWPAVRTCGLHGSALRQAAPSKCLSAENEARCRRSLVPNAALYEKGKSWAAVLVSLCTVQGEPAFLFTLRSSMLKGRHKGDVSFAGGKRDPSDRDVVATALREAREELGVAVAVEQVWGVLKPLRDMSGMMIAPVLASLGPLEVLSFRPNPSEVEEIFTLTLAHVCSPQNRGYTHFRTGNRYGYTLPVFRNGKHRVWGLTAVALDHTLKLLVP